MAASNTFTSTTETTRLQLERERLDLLVQQNRQGVIALFALAAAYLFVSWSIIPQTFLISWASILFASAFARIVLSIRWQKSRLSPLTSKQIDRWYFAIVGLLMVSGLSWGAIGWLLPTSPDRMQQLITCAVIVMMSSGSVVTYSSSLPAMIAVFFPSMLPWAISLLSAGESGYTTLGLMLSVYMLIGISVARLTNRYTMNSIQLNVENSELMQSLKSERERLELALEASGAATWTWNARDDRFTCAGNLDTLFGLSEKTWVGTLNEYLERAVILDRTSVREALIDAARGEKDLDVEFRIRRENGSICYLAQRGTVGSETPDILSGILWDVTEKNLAETLRRERRDSEAANKAKTMFLANASHEIRTPLAAINGFAEMALQSKDLPDSSRADIQMILRNGKYLGALVNDILDLSKIESGQIYIQKSAVSILEELADIEALLAPMAKAKGVPIKIVLQTAIPEKIESDTVRLREILINLLSNAVKFTNEGRVEVVMSFEVQDGKGLLRIRVQDTGIGISAWAQKHLFQPFNRGESEAVQKTQGSGLGLALSRNLAHLLGGELRLLKSRENEGSEFELTLATGDIALTGRMISPQEASLVRQKTGSATLTPERRLQGRSILVVDDSADLHLLMKRLLEKQGAVVETRSNGLQAVERLRDCEYDLVLMDIKMPVMDGYTATTTLRKLGFSRPIVALTAHASHDDRQLCYQSGFDSYVSKPVDFPHLLDELERFLDASPH